jgi:hypothetical protein
MIKLSPLRLNNHPDAKRAELIHNKVYIELAVEVRDTTNTIITDTNNLTHKGKYEVKTMLSGVVLAISEYCDAYRMGIRVGDTVLLAKELETNIYADGNKVPNMFCDIMSYKTLEEYQEYTKSPYNGPTVVIDDFKITGKIVSDEMETYPMINNDTKTIN